MNSNASILIGNSFPLSLIRRPVHIEPQPLAAMQAAADGAEIHSFWGHENTLAAAEAFCGLDLKPETARPALALRESGLPSLGGQAFRTCWILSPDYAEPFRPAVGEEVAPESIRGWQILKLTWE